jgi:hypothetical protein
MQRRRLQPDALPEQNAMNRLAQESSPYLLRHKDNPVHWYAWGPDAFAAAQAQDKPILLSIGYTACHWCHVMANESFANAQTAALMNADFINSRSIARSVPTSTRSTKRRPISWAIMAAGRSPSS